MGSSSRKIDVGQQRRGRHLQRVGSPGQPDRLADHQGEAEGHHQEGVGVAAVEPAQDRELERRPEEPDEHRRHGQRDPEVARPFVERVADESAQHVQRAMGEVHDAHQAEDQGEPDTEEEQQRRLRQRVDDLGQQKGEGTHAGYEPAVIPSVARDPSCSLKGPSLRSG